MRQCRRNGRQCSLPSGRKTKIRWFLCHNYISYFQINQRHSLSNSDLRIFQRRLFKFPRRAHFKEILQLAMLNLVSLSDASLMSSELGELWFWACDHVKIMESPECFLMALFQPLLIKFVLSFCCQNYCS